jgi:hypothetical protein
MRPNETLRVLNVWFGVCVIGTLLYLGLLAYDYVFLLRLSTLLKIYRWGEVPRELMPAYNVPLVTVLRYAAYAMWGVGFFAAMMQARECARSMGIVGHKWSGWAIGVALFVPVAGLVIPWLGFGEIRRSIIFSARHLSYSDRWRAESRFSATTVLLAASLIVNIGAIRVVGEEGKHATSASGVASVLSSMPLGMLIISLCFGVSLAYLFSTYAALRKLTRNHQHLPPPPLAQAQGAYALHRPSP